MRHLVDRTGEEAEQPSVVKTSAVGWAVGEAAIGSIPDDNSCNGAPRSGVLILDRLTEPNWLPPCRFFEECCDSQPKSRSGVLVTSCA